MEIGPDGKGAVFSCLGSGQDVQTPADTLETPGRVEAAEVGSGNAMGV